MVNLKLYLESFRLSRWPNNLDCITGGEEETGISRCQEGRGQEALGRAECQEAEERFHDP